MKKQIPSIFGSSGPSITPVKRTRAISTSYLLLSGVILLGWLVPCWAAERMTDLTSKWEVNHQPILGPFYNLYNPCVVHEPGQPYPYKMWLFGWAAEENNISTGGG